MDTETRQATDDQVRLYAFRVWSYKQGEVVSLMIHLGDRLGLYRAMAGAGTITSDDLATRTGLHERWLREWLRSQAAAGILETADGHEFRLPPEGQSVLVDEDSSLWFAAGAFSSGVVPDGVVDRLAEAFRTGMGLTYDDLGPTEAHKVERMLGPWTRLALVPVILPALDGVVDRLRSGARVADVGCGAGLALSAMAQAFPASSFEGFDPSEHAIRRAEERIRSEGLSNAAVHRRGAEGLPDRPTYDLVITLDCLHDMTHPDRTMSAIRRSIRDDGVWLIKEIRSSARWEENLKNPMLSMMYGTSVMTCMSSAMSEPDGAGLGTLGLHRELAEEMCLAAGFTRFSVRDFDDPANLYYEVRP